MSADHDVDGDNDSNDGFYGIKCIRRVCSQRTFSPWEGEDTSAHWHYQQRAYLLIFLFCLCTFSLHENNNTPGTPGTKFTRL